MSELDRIAAIWAAQKSQREIARALETTPSVISGLINRAWARGDARFAARPSPIRPKPAVVVKAKIRRAPNLPRPRPAPAPPVQPPAPIRFEQLRRGQCRFITTDVAPGRADLFEWCARPVATPGGNYCREHAELCTRGLR
jgi:hypothetical protein